MVLYVPHCPEISTAPVSGRMFLTSHAVGVGSSLRWKLHPVSGLIVGVGGARSGTDPCGSGANGIDEGIAAPFA